MVKNTKYFVYIVQCRDKTLYTGITPNLEKRLKQHNGQLSGGAKYTRSRRPVKIVYSEEYRSYNEALKREMEIKRLSRKQKENAIG